jgi:hypothetical protein
MGEEASSALVGKGCIVGKGAAIAARAAPMEFASGSVGNMDSAFAV